MEEKETLVDWLHRNGHIEDCFPIHNGATVAGFLRDMSIRKPWMSDELIERMRDYFGDRVALYFAFISLYTTCLLTYAGVGIVVFVLGLVPAIRPLVSLIFAVFSSFWSTYMLQSWYQRNIKLIYDWRGIVLGDGTDEKVFEKRLVEDVRAEFQGELKKDEITGELRPTASKEDTSRRFVISYTMISVFFLLAARTIFACFSFEDRMNAWLADEDDEVRHTPFTVFRVWESCEGSEDGRHHVLRRLCLQTGRDDVRSASLLNGKYVFSGGTREFVRTVSLRRCFDVFFFFGSWACSTYS